MLFIEQVRVRFRIKDKFRICLGVRRLILSLTGIFLSWY